MHSPAPKLSLFEFQKWWWCPQPILFLLHPIDQRRFSDLATPSMRLPPPNHFSYRFAPRKHDRCIYWLFLPLVSWHLRLWQYFRHWSWRRQWQLQPVWLGYFFRVTPTTAFQKPHPYLCDWRFATAHKKHRSPYCRVEIRSSKHLWRGTSFVPRHQNARSQ